MAFCVFYEVHGVMYFAPFLTFSQLHFGLWIWRYYYSAMRKKPPWIILRCMVRKQYTKNKRLVFSPPMDTGAVMCPDSFDDFGITLIVYLFTELISYFLRSLLPYLSTSVTIGRFRSRPEIMKGNQTWLLFCVYFVLGVFYYGCMVAAFILFSVLSQVG